MTLQELMNTIINKNLPKFMIWTGEELKVQEIFLNKICAGIEKIYLDNCEDIIPKLLNPGFSAINKCFVIVDDNQFKLAENKWKNIIQACINSNHMLILKYTKIDKKTKFYKQNNQYVVEFNKLSKDILKNYVWKELHDLNDDNCSELVEICNFDYGRILLEIDKIQRYKDTKIIDDSNIAYNELITQDAIYKEVGDITFELTDAVLSGYPDDSIKALHKAKLKQEPALRICSILYNGFRNLLSYKSMGRYKQDAQDRTGLNAWQLKQCRNWDGGYLIDEIIRNLKLCQKVESKIKSGLLDNDIALDYLVLSCIKN